MIPSAKNAWFNAWFARHARGRIQRTFGRVLVAGLERARSLNETAPLLLVANHSSWWDALVALYGSELLLHTDGYALMNAANLRRLPFFRRVGAFGVDLHDAADGAHAIRHAAKLLDRPRRAIWVFPQGEERSPFGELVLLPGAAQIAKVAKRAVVVPVGLRYVFGAAEQPDLWMAFGGALGREGAVADLLARQHAGIEGELARIDAVLAARDALGDFGIVHARPPSRLGQVAERILVRMTNLLPT